MDKLDNVSDYESIIKILQKENNALRNELQYLNLILENDTDISFLLDIDRKFVYASKAFLAEVGMADFGFINGKYYKKILKPLISQENLKDFANALAMAKLQKKTVTIEKEIDFNYKGDPRIFSIKITPELDQNGKSISIMARFIDITNIKSALEVAEHAKLSKTKFLATMSHEIRTPMNAIIGISDIELDKENHSPETREAFGKINNSGKILLGIMNDILDLAKLETGKLELLPEEYDTVSLIGDILQLNSILMGDKPIDLIVKPAETLPKTLIGDKLRIKQMLNNILSNAIKYTDQGTVSFEIEAQTDHNSVKLIFIVKDTGQGMTKEQLEAIHEQSSMFSREANHATEGVGFGMSIVKNLAQMMNGKIVVESEPNIGSTFTIILSQQPTDGNTIGKEQATELQNFKSANKTQRPKFIREYMPYGSVLIVDDVKVNLLVAGGLMKPYGLNIDTALSGYEVLEKINSGSSYDIIFMDHMMPGMDGMETTKQLREVGYTLPIIALTANAIVGQSEIFMENGFDDFLSKPIDTVQLNNVLNEQIRDKQPLELLEKARRQKENGEDIKTFETPASPPPDEDILSSLEEQLDPLELLKKIDGLNVDAALEAMSGLLDVYLDTVKLTVRLLPERIDRMDNYIDTDMKSFTVEVHGLKSVLKNIGAAALGNLATSLESAALENDAAYCKESYPLFKVGLLELTEHLSTALLDNSVVEKEIADKSSLVQVLAEVKTAAENYDRDSALEIVGPCANFVYDKEIDELLQEIIFALEAFDCEEAFNKINKLEENLNGVV